MNKYWIGSEEVNGVIIGGEFYRGKIFYDNRCQTYNPIYAETEEELINKANEIIKEFQEEWTKRNIPLALSCYPDSSKWELRIYD